MIARKLLLTVVAVAGAAQAARAQECGGRSGDEIILACDSAFSGHGLFITSARGWCYLINAASCGLP